MAKDEGKDLGYHWRRAAGVYDAPKQTETTAATSKTQTTSKAKKKS